MASTLDANADVVEVVEQSDLVEGSVEFTGVVEGAPVVLDAFGFGFGRCAFGELAFIRFGVVCGPDEPAICAPPGGVPDFVAILDQDVPGGRQPVSSPGDPPVGVGESAFANGDRAGDFSKGEVAPGPGGRGPDKYDVHFAELVHSSEQVGRDCLGLARWENGGNLVQQDDPSGAAFADGFEVGELPPGGERDVKVFVVSGPFGI
jgi:hypothetical protein